MAARKKKEITKIYVIRCDRGYISSYKKFVESITAARLFEHQEAQKEIDRLNYFFTYNFKIETYDAPGYSSQSQQ